MRTKLSFALFAALVATSPAALAERPPPNQVWFNTATAKQEAQRNKEYGLPMLDAKAGTPGADASSRIGAEFGLTTPLSNLKNVEHKLDTLAKNKKLAAKVLGPGLSFSRIKTRHIVDSLLDSPDGAAAAQGTVLRNRDENGVVRFNFKPASKRGPDGVAYETEFGINVPATVAKSFGPILKFFGNVRLKDNPLREFAKVFPGRKLDEMLQPSLDLKQDRVKYEIMGPNGTLAEITLDKITPKDPKTGRTGKPFVYIEGEANHIGLKPTTQQAAAQAASPWKGPHKLADRNHPSIPQNHNVQEVHRLAGVMSSYLGATPATEIKYSKAYREMYPNKAGAPAKAPKQPAAPRAARATR